MAKKKYTLEQFYNDAIALVHKYKIQIKPEQRFYVGVNYAFNEAKGRVLTFEIWYSNGLQEDPRKIVSSNERNPELALILFEADLMDVFNVGSELIDAENIEI